jgi:acetolactate synthase-1/2/3 large subunit
MNVATFLVTIINRLGVDSVFSLTGGMAMQINYAISKSPMRKVYCNHEQACVAAADGYARINNYEKPGLAVVTSGPGVTNTITAVASAFHDSVPLIVLAGQVKTQDINRLGVRSYAAQEVPSLALMVPIVKAAITYDPVTIDDQSLANVISLAVTGRKGPVFIEVPLDVQARIIDDAGARIEAIIQAILFASRKTSLLKKPASELIRSTIASSKRPVLFVGNGVRSASSPPELLAKVANKLHFPILTTWPSSDLVADSSLHFGSPGGLAPTHCNKILQSADLIIFIGVRLDLLTTGFSPERFGKNAVRLFVEIDGAERSKYSGTPGTICIDADARDFLQFLSDSSIECGPYLEWMRQCEEWRSSDRKLEVQAFKGDSSLNSRNIARCFSDTFDELTIVATASGYAIEGFARFFQTGNRRKLIFAGQSLGSMGLGLPVAIGAAVGTGGLVMCVEGDGGIMLNIQELLTLSANCDLALPIVILNNKGYRSIVNSQLRAFGSEFGGSDKSGVASPPFRELAEAFRYEYVKVTTLAALEAVMELVRLGKTPRILVDIVMSDEDYRGPAIVTKFRDDGTPYSTELEEISWRQ